MFLSNKKICKWISIFWKWHFVPIFDMNFNKQYEDCFLKKSKYFFEEFSKIFQEYSRKISPKVITKIVKKMWVWLVLFRLHLGVKLRLQSRQLCLLCCNKHEVVFNLPFNLFKLLLSMLLVGIEPSSSSSLSETTKLTYLLHA